MLFSRITFAVNNRKQKDKIKMTDKILKKSRVYRIKKVKRSRRKRKGNRTERGRIDVQKLKLDARKK